MKGALTAYRVMAYVTGVLLIVLCLVWGAELFGGSHKPVAILGQVHGFLYMVYLVTAFYLAIRARWKFLPTIGVLLAGTIPVVTFVVERKVTHWMRAANQAQPSVQEPSPTPQA